MPKSTNPVGLANEVLGKTDEIFKIDPKSGQNSPATSIQNFGKSMLTIAQGIFMYFWVLCVIAIGIFVTLILFFIFTITIMNKSTFVTPQTQYGMGSESSFVGSGGPVANCNSDMPPRGTTTDPIALRAYDIVNNLEAGIWGYWNKSPDYPQYWDPNLDPNVDFNSVCMVKGCNLFWCTYLVIKAYEETGFNICGINSCAYVPNMYTYFNSKNHWVSTADALANNLTNVKPGDTVFFRVDGSTRANGDHVGIVWQVINDPVTGQKSIITVESNNCVKSGTYTFIGGDASLNGVHIIGFGTH